MTDNFFAYFTHLNQYLIFLLTFLLIDFIHAPYKNKEIYKIMVGCNFQKNLIKCWLG